MSVFNTKQVDHHQQPMFLGDDTGIARYDNPKHETFESLIEKQLSFFWRPEEVPLTEDRAQYNGMLEAWQRIFTNNLKYQTLLDTVQGRAPAAAFLDLISDVGLETWTVTWTFSETIHSRSYTHIMRNLYNDPSAEFDTIVLNEAIMKRAGSVTKYYDALEAAKDAWKPLEEDRKRWVEQVEASQREIDALGDQPRIKGQIATIEEIEAINAYLDARHKHSSAKAHAQHWVNKIIHNGSDWYYARRDLMKCLYLCMHSVNTLEAIRFYVSFACTFNFPKNCGGILDGCAKIMKLIARDEQLHLKGTQYIINYWASGKEGPEWAEVAKECEAEAVQIFLDVVDQEKEWVDYLFQDGTVPGLDHQTLYNYIEYLAYSRMRAAGLPCPFENRRHPIPWIRHYLNSEAVQVAPQEVEISSYLVGQIDNDIAEEHFHKYKKYL